MRDTSLNNNLKNPSLEEVTLTLEQQENISKIQQEILSMVASHNSTEDILNRLCILAEKLLPNAVASIMLLNKKTGLISIKSAPSIPQEGKDALKNLKPGIHGGSCGNAIFKNEAQYVQNTFQDIRWKDLLQVAINFNICSCWSIPVRNTNKEAIGTFALSSFEHRSPSIFHKTLLDVLSSIVSIVLKNQKDEKKIALFSAVIQNAAEGMIVSDKNNNIIQTNETFEKLYGYKEEDIVNKNPNILSSGKHNKEFYKSMWNQINATSKWSGEITNKKSDGTLITQWMSIKALYNDKNQIQNYLAVFSDLTQLITAQKKLEHMAYHDSLTNLYNKSFYEKLLEEKNYKSLILLNIDNFSYINTVYGFEIGDELLINIANTIRENCHTKYIFKFNSDEFALLYEEKIDLESRIQEIQNYFNNNSIALANTKLNITFSYGANYSDENLLRDSASALKMAKENGKNRYCIFNEQEDSLDYKNKENFIKSSNLVRDAIEKNQIVPFFQGIYNNKENKITKYEALVRIKKDDEIISPFYFLDAAKLSGLLPTITKIMIDKTFRVMKNTKVNFSLNITEEDLSQNYLISYLEEKTKEYSIDINRVTLEILESVSATGKKNHITQLSTLKNAGFRIAIDDFGTEYSNFERILDLDVDFIKIDAKYIKDIHTNKRSYEITRALTFFAKNVNISCIAEFVHNKEVQKIIEDLGIDYSQGYYFSEPSDQLIK